MNKEESIEQLLRLKNDWEENGAFTKLNQTDINAIGIVMSDLEEANKNKDEIKEFVNKKIRHEYRNGNTNEFYLELNQKELKELLSIIGGNNDK